MRVRGFSAHGRRAGVPPSIAPVSATNGSQMGFWGQTGLRQWKTPVIRLCLWSPYRKPREPLVWKSCTLSNCRRVRLSPVFGSGSSHVSARMPCCVMVSRLELAKGAWSTPAAASRKASSSCLGLEDKQHQGQRTAVVLPGVAALEVAPVVLQPCPAPVGAWWPGVRIP